MAESRIPNALVRSKSTMRASGTRGTYAHATSQRTIASTTKSTMLCRKKCTSMLPTAASGRISRGNETFFTRPELATTDPVAAPSPVENRFHTSRPERSQIGNAGMPEPRMIVNAT